MYHPYKRFDINNLCQVKSHTKFNKEYKPNSIIFNFYTMKWNLSIYFCIPIQGFSYTNPSDLSFFVKETFIL